MTHLFSSLVFLVLGGVLGSYLNMHLYWSAISLLLGACVGSFLNVVAFRWPNNMSILRPSRSFCPRCGYQIGWYDNVPVLSFLCLRGKCRSCHKSISFQYPLVEMSTALIFLMAYDSFFVARQRLGVGQIETDWPILLGHWALWAGMITLTVMDLEAYMIDIRVTWIVSALGLLAHAFWTPPSSAHWIRPGVPAAALAIGATIGLVLGWFLFLRKLEFEEPSESPQTVEEPQASAQPPSTTISPRRWIGFVVPVLFVLIYLFTMGRVGEQPVYEPPVPPRLEAVPGAPEPSPAVWEDWGAGRLCLGVALLFVILVAVLARPQVQADVEIVETIDAEAGEARRKAFWELKLLSPAIILGVAASLLARDDSGAVSPLLAAVIKWTPIEHWHPIYGLSTALFGWVLGGAIGWLCRIIFTLLLGKEALGMGDVHLLAAAGAVAGWPVAFLGFFAAAMLALLGVIFTWVWYRRRAVAYVPWLALGFLITCIFQDRILAYFGIRDLL